MAKLGFILSAADEGDGPTVLDFSVETEERALRALDENEKWSAPVFARMDNMLRKGAAVLVRGTCVPEDAMAASDGASPFAWIGPSSVRAVAKSKWFLLITPRP